MPLLYSSPLFLRTVLLFSFTVHFTLKLTYADGLSNEQSTVLSDSLSETTTEEQATLFFEDSPKEPNKWKTFREWSCNNPTARNAYATASYSKMKVGGGKTSGMLVFGGHLFMNGKDQDYGTWYYDMDENLWQSVSKSNTPENRKGHIMITLCRTTVLMMGGMVLNRKKSGFHPVNDLWVFSDEIGTWKELLEDCTEKTCIKRRPRFLGSTAMIIERPLSPCHCKESVLILEETERDTPTVWELKCIQDRESYSWLHFRISDVHISGFEFVGKLTASSADQSLVYVVTANGVWQYLHNITGWSSVSLKDNDISDTNYSCWCPSMQHLNFIEKSIHLDTDRKVVLFGWALPNVLVFNPANGKWKSEAVVGTPPPNTYYSVSLIGSTILLYGGKEGGCRQIIWTLKRSSVASVWYWTQVPTPAIEPQHISVRTATLLGSDLYMRGPLPKPNPKDRDQLWKLDLKSMQWWQLRDMQAPVMNIGAMAATEDLSALILAGRANSNDTHFATWVVSLLSRNWQKLQSPKEIADTQAHSFVRIKETEFVLFGGFERGRLPAIGRTALNDTWLFRFNHSNPQSSLWLHIHDVVPNNKQRGDIAIRDNYLAPSPRYFHSVAVINTSMIAFGGQDQDRGCVHDLWSLDIETYKWRMVTPNNEGPRPTKRNSCFSSAAVVGPHFLVTTGCSPSFRQSHPLACNTANLQQTWLYLPHLSKWSFVAWIKDINTVFYPTTFLFNGYVVMAEFESHIRLLYLLPQCPDGMASKNMKKLPCQPCPIGTFAASSRDRCETCPEGLSTPSVGSSTISNCSECEPGSCLNGECLIYQVDGRPSPVCHCTFGFTGTNCSLPTYYIIALAVLLVTILIVCGTCALFRIRRRKQQREMELRRQVRELTSAWQVSLSELTIHDRIGAGGFGEVYKAHYRDLTVAVKFMLYTPNEGVGQEFEREIRFMQTIRHPNIVLFIGAGKDETADSSPFLITEYAQRGSLRGILDQLDTELSSKQRIKFAADAACGMNFLHTQEPARIHRDLKSDNLLVSSNWVVKVADFGLGRQLPQRLSLRPSRRYVSVSSPLLGDQIQMTAIGIGAARWRAPELVKGSTDYGTAVDVYSFGIVMWEIWSRQLPFLQYRFNHEVEDAVLEGARPPLLDDGPQVYNILMQNCWHHDPQMRPSFSYVLQQLECINDSAYV